VLALVETVSVLVRPSEHSPRHSARQSCKRQPTAFISGLPPAEYRGSAVRLRLEPLTHPLAEFHVPT
jgi:hypothetical protein